MSSAFDKFPDIKRKYEAELMRASRRGCSACVKRSIYNKYFTLALKAAKHRPKS